MSLVLSSKGLNLGSGGAGVSTSDVTSLIKQNSPWQYIETLDAANASELIFNNSEIENYDVLYVFIDNLAMSSQAEFRCNLFISGEEATGSLYGVSVHQLSGSTRNGGGGTGYNYWNIGPNSYTYEAGIVGEAYFTVKQNQKKSFKAQTGGIQSSSTAIQGHTSGTYNDSTNKVTGLKFYIPSNQFTDGKLHMYGLNKHD